MNASEKSKTIVVAKTFDEVLDNDQLRRQLTNAMLENKRIKRLIDLFILVLFMIFIMLTSI